MENHITCSTVHKEATRLCTNSPVSCSTDAWLNELVCCTAEAKEQCQYNTSALHQARAAGGMGGAWPVTAKATDPPSKSAMCLSP